MSDAGCERSDMADTSRGRVFLSNQTNLTNVTSSKYVSGGSINGRLPVRMSTAHVPEYSAEIMEYFLDIERTLYSSRCYMEHQTEVTDRMRKILVDWLSDVVSEFKHHPETFFLAVDIIDRYLQVREVPRAKLQLVGITAILIAAKHEEVWPPTVNDCVVVTANTYTAREVIDMERDVACGLRFKFTVPTVYPLACRFLDSGSATQPVRDAAFMYLESAVHCYPLLTYLPSRIAAACVALGGLHISYNTVEESATTCLSRFWTRDMSAVSRGIGFEELQPVAEQLLQFAQRLCSSSSRLQAVRRKYLSQRYSAVAALDFPPVSTLN